MSLHGDRPCALAIPRFFLLVQGVDEGDLGKDFASGKVADKPAQRGGAKLATHTTPHLRRHALRVAVFVLHQHPFDQVPVGKTEKIFFLLTTIR